jgi:hypothetical protein
VKRKEIRKIIKELKRVRIRGSDGEILKEVENIQLLNYAHSIISPILIKIKQKISSQKNKNIEQLNYENNNNLFLRS